MSDGCACGGSCGCGENHAHNTEQVYLSKEDYILRLEQYLKDLKAEIVAVEEELAQIREPALASIR